MKTRTTGIYAIFLGLSIAGLWALIFLTGEVEEGTVELSFHLAAEGFMALLCILGGALLLKKRKVAKLISLTAFGMVLYAVLNAAGYYGDKGEVAIAGMFLVLFVVTALAVYYLLKEQ